jgi:hypothetical protein
VTEALNPILFSSWCRISKMAIVFVPDHSDPNAVILPIIYLKQFRFLARSVGSLPCSDTSGVGGEADMPRQLDRRD